MSKPDTTRARLAEVPRVPASGTRIRAASPARRGATPDDAASDPVRRSARARHAHDDHARDDADGG